VHCQTTTLHILLVVYVSDVRVEVVAVMILVAMGIRSKSGLFSVGRIISDAEQPGKTMRPTVVDVEGHATK
jgi:hypothetical protein